MKARQRLAAMTVAVALVGVLVLPAPALAQADPSKVSELVQRLYESIAAVNAGIQTVEDNLRDLRQAASEMQETIDEIRRQTREGGAVDESSGESGQRGAAAPQGDRPGGEPAEGGGHGEGPAADGDGDRPPAGSGLIAFLGEAAAPEYIPPGIVPPPDATPPAKPGQPEGDDDDRRPKVDTPTAFDLGIALGSGLVTTPQATEPTDLLGFTDTTRSTGLLDHTIGFPKPAPQDDQGVLGELGPPLDAGTVVRVGGEKEAETQRGYGLGPLVDAAPVVKPEDEWVTEVGPVIGPPGSESFPIGVPGILDQPPVPGQPDTSDTRG